MSDEPEGSRSLRIETEFPDPPQIRRPQPEPPGLFRKSMIAGAVAGIVSSFAICGCGSVLFSSGEAMLVAAVLAAMCGISAWTGFVIYRSRLFARRPRRRPSRY